MKHLALGILCFAATLAACAPESTEAIGEAPAAEEIPATEVTPESDAPAEDAPSPSPRPSPSAPAGRRRAASMSRITRVTSTGRWRGAPGSVFAFARSPTAPASSIPGSGKTGRG